MAGTTESFRAVNPVPRQFGRHKLKAIVFEIEDAESGRHF